MLAGSKCVEAGGVQGVLGPEETGILVHTEDNDRRQVNQQALKKPLFESINHQSSITVFKIHKIIHV
jgi:hypothetical protein